MRVILALTVSLPLALGAAPAFAAPAPLPGATSQITVLPNPGTDVTALPVGDSRVTLTGAKAGWTWACTPGNPNAPGAIHDGPWIEGDTWNLLEKLAVRVRASLRPASMDGVPSDTSRDHDLTDWASVAAFSRVIAAEAVEASAGRPSNLPPAMPLPKFD